jgi:hypothetical protein
LQQESSIHDVTCQLQTLNTTGVIPNALTVLTAKREYTFRSFWDRDQSLQVIQECHAAVTKIRGSASLSSSNSSNNSLTTLLRRASSDSSKSSLSSSSGGNTAVEAVAASTPSSTHTNGSPTAESAAATSTAVPAAVSPTSPAEASQPVRTVTEDEMELDVGGDLDGCGVDAAAAAAVTVDPKEAFEAAVSKRSFKYHAATMVFPDMSLNDFMANFIGSEDIGGGSDDGERESVSARDSPSGGSDSGRSSSSGAAGGGGSSDSSSGAPGSVSGGGGSAGMGAGSALGSPHVLGIAEWHTLKGDSEVVLEDWKEVAEVKAVAAAGIRSHVRSFRFRTPIVGSPIGPSSTRATKTQCFRRYGSSSSNTSSSSGGSSSGGGSSGRAAGCVMDTVTVLEDIPFGDCFEVEDRWVVTPLQPPSSNGYSGGSDDGSSSGGVELTIAFEIRWIKGTMWKRAIETKTKTDMITFFENCVQTMQKRLRERREGGDLSGTLTAGAAATVTAASSAGAAFTTTSSSLLPLSPASATSPSSTAAATTTTTTKGRRPARTPSSPAALAAAAPAPPWLAALPWVLLGLLLLLQLRREWRSSSQDGAVMAELASLRDSVESLQKVVLETQKRVEGQYRVCT